MTTELEAFEDCLKRIIKDEDFNLICKRAKENPIFIINNVINDLEDINHGLGSFDGEETRTERIDDIIEELKNLIEKLKIEEQIKEL